MQLDPVQRVLVRNHHDHQETRRRRADACRSSYSILARTVLLPALLRSASASASFSKDRLQFRQRQGKTRQHSWAGSRCTVDVRYGKDKTRTKPALLPPYCPSRNKRTSTRALEHAQVPAGYLVRTTATATLPSFYPYERTMRVMGRVTWDYSARTPFPAVVWRMSGVDLE